MAVERIVPIASLPVDVALADAVEAAYAPELEDVILPQVGTLRAAMEEIVGY